VQEKKNGRKKSVGFYPAFCGIVKSVPARREQQKKWAQKTKTVHGSA
jgi:hypothetical protein